MSLANIFRSTVPEGLRGEARHTLAGSPAPASTSDAATNARANLAASAATRLNAAKAELNEARSASMTASLACKAAEGHKSAAERHQLRLSHRAATERLEVAHAAVNRCQGEFDAAFRNFQSVA